MRELIDKAVVVAEIKRRINGLKDCHADTVAGYVGEISGLERLLSFLNTLEVKEVQEETISNDLEEAAREWLKPKLDKSYINYGESKMMELTHFDGYAMLDATEFGAQWQKEQMEKEVDLEKEFDNYANGILACDVQFEPFTHLHYCAKHFYELGLKAKGE
jgi:hypothetical protein